MSAAINSISEATPARPNFETLAEAELHHFWFRARRQLIGALAGGLTGDLPPRPRILEIGCGNGAMLTVLATASPGARVVGMDLFREGLGRLGGAAALVQADAAAPPFRSVFHLVGIFDVLEHVPDDAAVLRQVRAVLAPRGRLILTVPGHPRLWSYADEASSHFRRYSLDGLARVLAGAGYAVEYMTHFMTAVAPLVWLARRIAPAAARVRGRGADHHALAVTELRLPALLNRLLGLACTPEHALIERRWRLPVGTSIAVVAAPLAGDDWTQ
jgi:SAM-dependent methyltransferase